MDLLQELIGLSEAKKKPCCKKCEMKANKAIAQKLMKSGNIRESLAEIFASQLNEGKAVGNLEKTANGAVFTIYDDLENPFVDKIAKAIGAHDGGNLKKLGDKCFVAYNHGADLTFYQDPADHVEDDDN